MKIKTLSVSVQVNYLRKFVQSFFINFLFPFSLLMVQLVSWYNLHVQYFEISKLMKSNFPSFLFNLNF